MNKYQEAVSILRNDTNHLYNTTDGDQHQDHREDVERLQELVDRATPKKIIHLKSEKNSCIRERFDCPVCGKTIRFKDNNFCPNCGQALDGSCEKNE
jgi:rubrerythrin